MALTIRGEASTWSNTVGSQMSLACPASTAVGDTVLLLHADDFYTAAALTTPTGTAVSTWNLQHTYDGGSDLSHCKVWTGLVTTGGASTVIANSTNTDEERYAQIIVFGPNVAYDVAASSVVASSTSYVNPAVTAAGADDVLVNLAGVTVGGDINFTMAASMTALTERDGTGFATWRTAYEQLSASGSTGTRTHTASAARAGFVVTVAMKSTGAAAVTAQKAAPRNRARINRAYFW
jgi:hypothetical protein